MRFPLSLLAPVLALAATLPLAAESLSGPATALDGDTLVMAGERIRLHGIDAPEGTQTCDRKGARWACGNDAKALLAGMVSGRTVECVPQDRDHYGRIVAACRTGDRDLGGVMVREGMAIALPSFSDAYVEAEARARSFGMALWGSVFQTPAEYRAANPALFKAPAPRPEPGTAGRASGARPAAVASVVFRNCAAARAAGAAPLYRGRPGYGTHMDGDGDGVACEPYRGRR